MGRGCTAATTRAATGSCGGWLAVTYAVARPLAAAAASPPDAGDAASASGRRAGAAALAGARAAGGCCSRPRVVVLSGLLDNLDGAVAVLDGAGHAPGAASWTRVADRLSDLAYLGWRCGRRARPAAAARPAGR